METNVREVATRLARAGEAVKVYASDLYDEARWERRSSASTLVDGVPVERFPVYKRLIPGLTMPLMPGLVQSLARDAPEIVHAHSHRYGHVLEAAAVCHELDIPLVVSTHYHPADRREPPLKRGLLRAQDHLFGMTAYRGASALVVETEFEAGLVREFAPAGTIRVIPPGVDLSAWRTTAPDGPIEGAPEPYLLYAGRIASNKGLPGLILALSRIPESRRPHAVLLGPDWGQRARLERFAEALRVEPWIHFLGAVESPVAYRRIFRRARLFVLPSEWEAFGLVLLDAMAAEVPIVATAVGGVPEVLQEGRVGRLVPFGDPAALAGAIEAMWSDEAERQRAVEAGRTRVQGLDWSVATERHRALYRELLN